MILKKDNKEFVVEVYKNTIEKEVTQMKEEVLEEGQGEILI